MFVQLSTFATKLKLLPHRHSKDIESHVTTRCMYYSYDDRAMVLFRKQVTSLGKINTILVASEKWQVFAQRKNEHYFRYSTKAFDFLKRIIIEHLIISLLETTSPKAQIYLCVQVLPIPKVTFFKRPFQGLSYINIKKGNLNYLYTVACRFQHSCDVNLNLDPLTYFLVL